MVCAPSDSSARARGLFLGGGGKWPRPGLRHVPGHAHFVVIVWLLSCCAALTLPHLPSPHSSSTGLSYDRVKAALETVNNLEELCHVISLHTNIHVEPDVEAVVKVLLGVEWLTWRRLIWWLDWASETEAAEALFGFAEPLAGMCVHVCIFQNCLCVTSSTCNVCVLVSGAPSLTTRGTYIPK